MLLLVPSRAGVCVMAIPVTVDSADPLRSAAERRMMIRAVVASAVGTTIEWYDFFLYGVGGEWGGSVLLAGEWTNPKRRGFTTSWAQFGAPAGLMLANGAVSIVTYTTSEEQFLSWGWRVPFLISVVLVFIGLYIRIGILETPVFARLKAQGKVEKAPVTEVLRRNWREVILTALLRTGQQTPFYIFTTYILTYGTQVLGLSRRLLLNLVMLQATISLATIPLFGHLSDVIGRR